jgi:hypothetical protein
MKALKCRSYLVEISDGDHLKQVLKHIKKLPKEVTVIRHDIVENDAKTTKKKSYKRGDKKPNITFHVFNVHDCRLVFFNAVRRINVAKTLNYLDVDIIPVTQEKGQSITAVKRDLQFNPALMKKKKIEEENAKKRKKGNRGHSSKICDDDDDETYSVPDSVSESMVSAPHNEPADKSMKVEEVYQHDTNFIQENFCFENKYEPGINLDIETINKRPMDFSYEDAFHNTNENIFEANEQYEVVTKKIKYEPIIYPDLDLPLQIQAPVPKSNHPCYAPECCCQKDSLYAMILQIKSDNEAKYLHIQKNCDGRIAELKEMYEKEISGMKARQDAAEYIQGLLCKIHCEVLKFIGKKHRRMILESLVDSSQKYKSYLDNPLIIQSLDMLHHSTESSGMVANLQTICNSGRKSIMESAVAYLGEDLISTGPRLIDLKNSTILVDKVNTKTSCHQVTDEYRTLCIKSENPNYPFTILFTVDDAQEASGFVDFLIDKVRLQLVTNDSKSISKYSTSKDRHGYTICSPNLPADNSIHTMVEYLPAAYQSHYSTDIASSLNLNNNNNSSDTEIRKKAILQDMDRPYNLSNWSPILPDNKTLEIMICPIHYQDRWVLFAYYLDIVINTSPAAHSILTSNPNKGNNTIMWFILDPLGDEIPIPFISDFCPLLFQKLKVCNYQLNAPKIKKCSKEPPTLDLGLSTANSISALADWSVQDWINVIHDKSNDIEINIPNVNYTTLILEYISYFELQDLYQSIKRATISPPKYV